MKEKLEFLIKQAVETVLNTTKAHSNTIFLNREKHEGNLVCTLLTFVNDSPSILAFAYVGIDEPAVFLNGSYASLQKKIKMALRGALSYDKDADNVENFCKNCREVGQKTTVYDELIRQLIAEPNQSFDVIDTVSQEEIQDFALMAYPDKYEETKQKMLSTARYEELKQAILQYSKRELNEVKFPEYRFDRASWRFTATCPVCGSVKVITIPQKETVESFEIRHGLIDRKSLEICAVVSDEFEDHMFPQPCEKCGFDVRTQLIFGKHLQDIAPAVSQSVIKKNMTAHQIASALGETEHFIYVERVPNLADTMLIRVYEHVKREGKALESFRLFINPEFSAFCMKNNFGKWLCLGNAKDPLLTKAFDNCYQRNIFRQTKEVFPLQDNVLKIISRENRLGLPEDIILKEENGKFFTGIIWDDHSAIYQKDNAQAVFRKFKKEGVEHLFQDFLVNRQMKMSQENENITVSQLLSTESAPITEKAIKAAAEHKLSLKETQSYSLLSEEMTVEEFLDIRKSLKSFEYITEHRKSIAEIAKLSGISQKEAISRIAKYAETEMLRPIDVLEKWLRYARRVKDKARPGFPIVLDEKINRHNNLLSAVSELQDSYIFQYIPAELQNERQGKYNLFLLSRKSLANAFYCLSKSNKNIYMEIYEFTRMMASENSNGSNTAFAVLDGESVRAVISVFLQRDKSSIQLFSDGKPVPEEIFELTNKVAEHLKDGYASMKVER